MLFSHYIDDVYRPKKIKLGQIQDKNFLLAKLATV
jgi:hypothetical protein